VKLMPIRRLLDGSGLGSADVDNLCRAYEDALHALYLVERNEIARSAIKALGMKIK
jgi:hypothetical protein